MFLVKPRCLRLQQLALAKRGCLRPCPPNLISEPKGSGHTPSHPSPRCWCGVGVVAPTSRMHRSLLVTITLHDPSYVMTHKHSPLSSSEYQSPLHRTLPTPFYFVRSSAKKHVDIIIAVANTLLCTAVFEAPRRVHISKGCRSGRTCISHISGQALPGLAAHEQYNTILTGMNWL